MLYMFMLTKGERMKCTLKVGVLISHPCSRQIKHTCPVCSTKVCDRHFNQQQNKCHICTKEYKGTSGLHYVKEPFNFLPEEHRVFDIDKKSSATQDYLDS